MNESAPQSRGLLLRGLDGSNPLAFLAALGTLRTLSATWSDRDVKICWLEYGAAWRPSLFVEPGTSEDEVVQVLDREVGHVDAMFLPRLLEKTEQLSPKNKKGEPKWRDKLRFPQHALVTVVRSLIAAARLHDRPLLDYTAAWATDAVIENVDKQKVARRTRFDFTAGNQAIIGMMRELRESCAVADMDRCLFGGWQYPSDSVSLRWDPLDETRQYALQAIDPTDGSQNPIRSEPGANLLAVEGLPLFPLVPTAEGASQPGFDRTSEGRFWTWPIWKYPATVDMTRSILSLPESAPFQTEFGISNRYRSRIVQPSGRYRCFTPAEAL